MAEEFDRRLLEHCRIEASLDWPDRFNAACSDDITAGLNASREETLLSEKRFELIRIRDFQKDGTRVFDLARNLVRSANGSISARKHKEIRKTAAAMEKRLYKMTQYLNGNKPTEMVRNSERPVQDTLREKVAEIARTLNAVRSDLLKVGRIDAPTVDIRLRQSVMYGLQIAQQIAAEIAGQ